MKKLKYQCALLHHIFQLKSYKVIHNLNDISKLSYKYMFLSLTNGFIYVLKFMSLSLLRSHIPHDHNISQDTTVFVLTFFNQFYIQVYKYQYTKVTNHGILNYIYLLLFLSLF